MKKDIEKLVEGKKIPICILDPKWHELFRIIKKTPEISSYEKKLGELLKMQGKAGTESTDIKKLKSKLMKEIVELSAEVGNSENSKISKQLAEKKRLIEECNDKLKEHEDELDTVPDEIEETNRKLVLETLNVCYSVMKQNDDELISINEWIDKVRVSLKKQILRKQDREEKNRDLYNYLHGLFGMEVLDIFDFSYKPNVETKEEKKTSS